MKRVALRIHTPGKLRQLQKHLDEIHASVETSGYIEDDPVQFVHAFSEKREIEIAGFFAATMAWGRREIVIAKMDDLLNRMDYKPMEFILNYNSGSYRVLETFKHRTLKPVDVEAFIYILQKIYNQWHDLEQFWAECYQIANASNRPLLSIFHEHFFALHPETPARTFKHISNPEKGSTCKRLYMFLRWMIRKNSPVDIGIWNFMPASQLLIPFDVHVARQSRRYGLLSRKSNDWLAVQELTEACRVMNPADPAVYDFALFGMGALGYQLPNQFILNDI